MFSDPMLIPKLAANPKTRDLVQDPEVLAKIMKLKQNPNDIQRCVAISEHSINDMWIIDC